MKRIILILTALCLVLSLGCAAAEENAAAETTEVKTVNVGDVVVFGAYEQDNVTDNGAEPIEWTVLDVQDGEALLLTKYAIDSINYHPGHREKEFPTWARSFVRGWLNGDFMNAAFTAEEQAAIKTKLLANPTYKQNAGGKDTEDKVFFLARHELEQYMTTYESRMCLPTEYAVAQGAWVSSKYTIDGKPCTWWWLRTPGYYRSCASSVRTRGTITSNRVYDNSGAVRPAIWVDINAL